MCPRATIFDRFKPALHLYLGIVLLCMTPVRAFSQDWTDWLGPQGSASLRARLKDKKQNAENHIASVEVEVQDIWLNFPNAAEQPGIEVGVSQYQVDHCPAVVTTDTELRFEGLKPGGHSITVGVLGLDNSLLTPKAKLEVRVP